MVMLTESSNALEGIHPTFKQVPPSVWYFSTKAVFIPNWAQRMALTYPPGPDPITTTSYELIEFLFFSSGKVTQRTFVLGFNSKKSA